MIIAVASGKGGTGKTLLATGLAHVLAADVPGLCLLDCDVEEPNAHLFLEPEFDHEEEVTLLTPEIDVGRCDLCGRCAEVCAFHALAVLPGKVLAFPQLCHGCGSCALQCPRGAISERPKLLGLVQTGRAGSIRFGHGLLEVGQAMATPIIRRLKQRLLSSHPAPPLTLLDAPPGNACPVVETLRGSDFALLVTEPTPFGLHDLEIAVEVARDQLGIPVGVVINRDRPGHDGVDRFCAGAGVPVLLRLPLDRRIAEVYSDGALWVEALLRYREPLRRLYRDVRALLGVTA